MEINNLVLNYFMSRTVVHCIMTQEFMVEEGELLVGTINNLSSEV